MTETHFSAQTPKLPLLAAVSCAMPAPALTNLQKYCSTVVLLPPDPLLPAPIASHADMLLFPIGDALVVHKRYYDIAQVQIDTILCRSGRKLILTNCLCSNIYPLDVALNAFLCDRFLFGRLDVLAPEILSLAKEAEITPVHIRQGYAGCSGIAVGSTVITADPSLTKAARTCGLSVFSVPDKDILLPGYDHGFFGGCGGVGENTVFLCGTPSFRIPDFLSAVYLSADPLYDCGGIRFFHQYK